MQPDPQELLWRIPNMLGHGWWYLCSGLATAALLTMFLYMVMNERFSALLVARSLLLGSMLCFALLPLNSGWLPWGVLLASAGCLYSAFLIATDWCHRQNKWARVLQILGLRRREQDAHQRTRHWPSD